MSAIAEMVQTAQQDSLPPGWTIVTIEDLVGDGGMFIDGDWVESKDQDPEGDVRLIQLADIGDGEYRNKSARFLTHAKAIELGCTFLRKGDVLIARMPDPLGRACIFPGDSKLAITVVDVAIVRSAAGEFDHRWLMHFVNAPAFRFAVASMQSGSTRKRISRGNLAKISLPVPPLDQQKRIVAEIEKQFSRLDEAVANLKRVKANLKRYKASVLKAAVEGRLVETEAELARREGRNFEPSEQLLQRILETRRNQWRGKGKYKEPAAPDATDLSELPKDWVWASVDQLVVHLTDGDHQPPPQTDEGVPFLVIGNVRNGEINFSDTRHVGEAYYASLEPNRKPKQGDLLYTLVGSYGIPVPVKTDAPFCIQRHMAILRPHDHSPMEYLSLAMASNNVFKQATAIATGTAQKTVPLAGLRRIAIPLPPLAEQVRIVAEIDRRLSLLHEIEVQVVANLHRAERLRQSILADAFSGRLAVSNNSTIPTTSAVTSSGVA